MKSEIWFQVKISLPKILFYSNPHEILKQMNSSCYNKITTISISFRRVKTPILFLFFFSQEEKLAQVVQILGHLLVKFASDQCALKCTHFGCGRIGAPSACSSLSMLQNWGVSGPSPRARVRSVSFSLCLAYAIEIVSGHRAWFS